MTERDGKMKREEVMEEEIKAKENKHAVENVNKRKAQKEIERKRLGGKRYKSKRKEINKSHEARNKTEAKNKEIKGRNEKM